MNICITGDSWGVGEWSGKDEDIVKYRLIPEVTHRGLQQYFTYIGHSVTNKSNPGSCNRQAIWRLEVELTKKKYDYIFWFQSDPLRDLRYTDDPSLKKLVKYEYFDQKSITYEDLLRKHDEILTSNYNRINKIGQPIHCIGGCSKLDIKLMSYFKNLVPLVPSVTELLLPNYEHPKLWHSDWVAKINRQLDIPSLDKLLMDKRKQDHLFEEKTYFWPDGLHPNKLGHKVLFEYICQQLKFDNKSV